MIELLETTVNSISNASLEKTPSVQLRRFKSCTEASKHLRYTLGTFRNSSKSINTRFGACIPEIDESPQQIKEMLKQEVLKVFYKKNYNWQPLVYDSYKAWTYVFGRAAKEYAAIKQVFNEIEKRDPEFQPRSFFDFGAGIGTGAWAAAQNWKNTLYEYFLVDESRDMNDLSELILRDGNENKNMSLKNVFFRQFLPASDEVNY